MTLTLVVLCVFVTAIIVLVTTTKDSGKGVATTEDKEDTTHRPAEPSEDAILTSRRVLPSFSTRKFMVIPRGVVAATAPFAPLPKVCTVGDDGVEPLIVPDDGLCSFVFYHPLRISESTRAFGTGIQITLNSFFKRAQHDSKTRYGMSVNLRDVAKFRSAFRTPRGKQDYESYWNVGIYDWGFLSINEFQVNAGLQRVAVALRILKELQEYAESNSDEQAFMFLGIYSRSERICAAFARHMNTIFSPAAVIILGHLSYNDPQNPRCTVMPPTNFKDPRLQGSTYGHSIRDAVHLARCLKERGVRTNFSVSLTMRGRWTRPKRFSVSSSHRRANFYDDCYPGNYEEVGALKAICDDPRSLFAQNLAYDNSTKAVITFDEKLGYALTFDNERSLLEKICDAWENVTDLDLGLAAYDVNHDNRDTKCGAQWINNRWSRLRFLLKLSAFIEQYYKKPHDKKSCIQFT
ncbi:uncharacterized protein LOC144097737 [Amblyomma americanum]